MLHLSFEGVVHRDLAARNILFFFVGRNFNFEKKKKKGKRKFSFFLEFYQLKFDLSISFFVVFQFCFVDHPKNVSNLLLPKIQKQHIMDSNKFQKIEQYLNVLSISKSIQLLSKILQDLFIFFCFCNFKIYQI